MANVGVTWRRRMIAGTLGALACVLGAPDLARAQGVFALAIRNGQSIPGLSGTVVSTTEPAIGAGGHVVALCTMSTGRAATVVCIPGSPVRAVIQTGVQAPGVTNGATLSLITNAWPDGQGRVYVEGDLAGAGVTSSNNKCHWIDDNGTITLTVREGDPVPASAGQPAGTIFGQVVQGAFANGRTAFAATLSGGGTTTANDRSLWTFRNGALTLVAREGDASGIVAGADWADFADPYIDNAGRLHFYARLSGGTATDTVIVRGQPGALAIVAREGSTATGAGTGVVFSTGFIASYALHGLGVNTSGDVLFPSVLLGTGVNTNNNVGLFLRAGATTSMVNRENVQVPGIIAIAPFFGEPRTPVIGLGGTCGWTTELRDSVLVNPTNDTRVYRRTGSSADPDIVLGEGTQVPGSDSGVTFDDVSGDDYDVESAMNGDGDILVQAPIAGTGLGQNATALIARRGSSSTSTRIGPPGSVQTLAHASVSSGTIFGLTGAFHFNSTGQGRPTSINDAGACVVIAQFTTGAGTLTGAFVVNLDPANDAGACCVPGGCVAAAQAACATQSGSFRGAGSVCNQGGSMIAPCCIADFNLSGAVSVQDVFDYLNAFFAGAPSADINNVGGVTVQDIFDYLGAFFAGCA